MRGGGGWVVAWLERGLGAWQNKRIPDIYSYSFLALRNCRAVANIVVVAISERPVLKNITGGDLTRL